MIKSIIRDTASLAVITVVAAICLAFVHGLTEDKIAQAEADERTASYREVFPGAADFIANDKDVSGETDIAGVTIEEALLAVDGNGEIIGCVISSTSANGYGGDVTLSVGVDLSNTITGMRVTSMSESPGYGSHCQDEEFEEQFKGLGGEITYVSDGADEPGEIDMISGATFTSRAVTEAVNGALDCARSLLGGE